MRTVFCLFVADTGIFLGFSEERTAPDGSDLRPWLMRLFQVLGTPPDRRQAKLDADRARCPHVNGDLLEGAVRIPDFDAGMRRALPDAGQFDWTAISSASSGSCSSRSWSRLSAAPRGVPYTTEKSIRKVIEPFFLDDLRAEFRRLQARRDIRTVADLPRFRDKLGSLRLFDPECGCGNFLIIAYRELRTLEIDVLREIASKASEAISR